MGKKSLDRGQRDIGSKVHVSEIKFGSETVLSLPHDSK